uniref:Uncharacterized protein n=1 Tax=Magallana gigas TaxID=29159 RepID=K1PNQ3_MAGGI
MRDRLTLCFSAACEDQFSCYQSPEDAKKAKLRNRQISKVLKQHQKEELKKLKILLLGTGESGKSTLTKQMRIIHINGFDMSFLDKIAEIKSPAYVPSDQDILRCRCVTTSIQHIEFGVPDGGHQVKFNVYDVGGQQGERKKWIQVFDSVTAILFVVDCSSFDQTLREDPEKNRLLEALENFDQVWNNRFLRYVSVLLFINKIDVLAEKIARGRDILELTEKYPDVFPDFETFTPTDAEKEHFLDAFATATPDIRRKTRQTLPISVHPDTVKTAVYIKRLFKKIVKGELLLKERITKQDKHWHDEHSCEFFYTCAIDTNNIQRVLNGCRTLIVQNHLRRYGII